MRRSIPVATALPPWLPTSRNMFSLSTFRYRKVLAADGGPVHSIESRAVAVSGVPMVQVNACLTPGLTTPRDHYYYGDADGTGTHRLADVATQYSISEAIKRWAFDAIIGSDQAGEFAFDIDPSSTGVAAASGLTGRKARRQAMLAAVERFSLNAWWEGSARWRLFDTDWPGVSAVAIDGPFGGVTVIAFSRTSFGMYAYGHAAEESFGAACERAIISMARHEQVLHAWWLSAIAGVQRPPSNRFERRSLFFATEAGHELFLRRIQDGVQGEMKPASLLCDREIPGPWTDFTTVWRYALRPQSENYLMAGEDYFFW